MLKVMKDQKKSGFKLGTLRLLKANFRTQIFVEPH